MSKLDEGFTFTPSFLQKENKYTMSDGTTKDAKRDAEINSKFNITASGREEMRIAEEKRIKAARDKWEPSALEEQAKVDNARKKAQRREIEWRESLKVMTRDQRQGLSRELYESYASNFEYKHLDNESISDIEDLNFRLFERSCRAQGVVFSGRKAAYRCFVPMIEVAYAQHRGLECGWENRQRLYMYLIMSGKGVENTVERLAKIAGEDGRNYKVAESLAKAQFDELSEALLDTEGTTTGNMGELFASIDDDREPLITPLLSTRESAAVWAKTGIGKTWFTLSVALAAAGGHEFGDMKGHGVKVLYLDGEMYANDLKERAELIIDKEGWDKDKIMGNIELYLRTVQNGGAAIDMNKSSQRDMVIHKCVKLGCKMLVLDNLATLWPSDNENDATSFNAMNDFIAECRTRNIGVLIVDHSNKNGTDMRGSSNKKTVLNVCCGLRALPSVEGETNFTVVFDKWRGEWSEMLKAKEYNLGLFGWNIKENVEAAELSKAEYIQYKLVNNGVADIEELWALIGIKGCPDRANKTFKNNMTMITKIHKNKGHDAPRNWYEGYFTDAASEADPLDSGMDVDF